MTFLRMEAHNAPGQTIVKISSNYYRVSSLAVGVLFGFLALFLFAVISVVSLIDRGLYFLPAMLACISICFLAIRSKIYLEITKSTSDGSLIVQKRFIFRTRPTVFTQDEAPEIKMIIIPSLLRLGTFSRDFAAIVSREKGCILRPLKVVSGSSIGFAMKEQDARWIAAQLGIPFSEQPAKFVDIFRYLGH